MGIFAQGEDHDPMTLAIPADHAPSRERNAALKLASFAFQIVRPTFSPKRSTQE